MQLSDDEIKITVEAAFRPLRCVAEVCDYEQKCRGGAPERHWRRSSMAIANHNKKFWGCRPRPV